MLSPSADQYSGRTAVHDYAACSTCNSKEVLSPSTGHCCGQTAMQDLYAKRATARRHCLPQQTNAVVRLSGMSKEMLSPSADQCCGQTVRHE